MNDQQKEDVNRELKLLNRRLNALRGVVGALVIFAFVQAVLIAVMWVGWWRPWAPG